MASVLATSLSGSMAMAEDCTNKYFSTPMTPAAVEITTTTSAPVILENTTCAPALIERNCSSPVVIEKTFSAPVVVEKTAPSPVVLEDRLIKQKHAFGLGIWPLFDVTLM
jgi:hypothetical protein